MGRHRVEAPPLRVELPEQRARVEDGLGRHLVELGEVPPVGLLGLVVAAWSQLPMDVAAAAVSVRGTVDR